MDASGYKAFRSLQLRINSVLRDLSRTAHRLGLSASRFQRLPPHSPYRCVSDDVAVVLDLSWAAARGDQRERDRQRAQARRPVAKGRGDGLTPEQRRERDAKALQEKAARKAAQAAGGGGGGGGGGADAKGGKNANGKK
ncbi:unnamed protein product [Miscanthus lutarioriparius]|uniref:Small EDRK-rich factor-like N-terminal domain-containing protein n=1 Tax=Miscanthus lutarioriparius TaxID=422564 RepID=A0A811RX66_9POAL|nr:unnamed protein product [Miscanthus lutarioriparius]